MAETTGISWTRSTFNPWIGCTKIGPGCDHCYAAEQDSRKRWDGGKTHWGAGVPRYRTSVHNWNLPLRWNRLCALERETGKVAVQSDWHTPGFWPVFCASLADVFDTDNMSLQHWRLDLWDLIEATPNLSWLLVTKRIGNVAREVPNNWLANGFPPNVRMLITVVNQEEADRDIPKLLVLPCKNGISYEPALGPITFKDDWLDIGCAQHANHGFLHWIIVGGESLQGGQARAFDIEWARSTIAQCKAAGVACFVKQLAPHPTMGDESSSLGRAIREGGYVLKDRAGADPAEWPEDLRVREFPDNAKAK